MKHVFMKLGACLAVMVIALLPALPVFSSDISDADFYGVIQTSNNSTAASAVASNVSGLNSSELIAAGYLNASANNCAIRSSSGADLPFMPGYGSSPWLLFFGSLGADSISNSIAYFKGVTGGAIRYFPGSTGITIVDDDTTLDSSNNITWAFTGVMPSTGTVFQKSGAYLASMASGNLSLAISASSQNFTTYTEQDAGGYISETANNITATAVTSTTDCYLYKDFGVNYFNALNIPFTIKINGDGATPLGLCGPAITNTLNDRSGFAVTDIYVMGQPFNATDVYINLGRGNGVAQDTSVVLVPAKLYYCTLTRAAGSDDAYCYIYNDSARTSLADTLTIAGVGAATRWRYAMGFVNNNSGVANRNFTGFVADMSIGGGTFDLGAVTSTEKTSLAVSVNATSGNVTLWQNGSILSNTTLSGATIPDNTNSILLGGSGTMYFETASVSVNGTLRAQYQWQYAATFTDLSGNGNTGTPSYRTTSSDADVTSILVSFQPIAEPTAPAFAVGEGPGFFDTSNVTTGNFTTGNVTLDYPLKDLIEDVATAGGVPYQIPSTFISSFCVIVLSMLTSFFLKRYSAQSIFLKTIVNTAAYGVLVALHIYDWWMLIFFFIFEASIWFGAQHRRE